MNSQDNVLSRKRNTVHLLSYWSRSQTEVCKPKQTPCLTGPGAQEVFSKDNHKQRYPWLKENGKLEIGLRHITPYGFCKPSCPPIIVNNHVFFVSLAQLQEIGRNQIACNVRRVSPHRCAGSGGISNILHSAVIYEEKER